MRRGMLVGLLGLVLSVPASAATFQGSVTSRVPADTNGIYRRSVSTTTTITLTFLNVGTSDWSATAGQNGYVVVASFDSNLTTPTASPLASNWLTPNVIGTITPNTVVGLGNDPQRETSIWLRWTAPGDDGFVGRASQYDIRYTTSALNTSSWNTAARVLNPPTPALAGTRDSCRVTGLLPQTTYTFGVKTSDEVPNWSGLSNVVSAMTPTAHAVISFQLHMPDTPGRYSLSCALALAPSNQIISSGIRLNFDVIGAGSPPPPPAPTPGTVVPFAGQFTSDHFADVGYWDQGSDDVGLAMANVAAGAFVPGPTFTWPAVHGADSLFAGQFIGDGLADLCVHQTNGDWYVAENTGNGFLVPTMPVLRGFGANRTPIAADFNADGLVDVGYFNPDSLCFFVALNTGAGFVPYQSTSTGGSWLVWALNPPPPYRPITGRFNTDRYVDVGLRNPALGEWFVAMSNGRKFATSPGYEVDDAWLADWPAGEGGSTVCTGRVSADTLDDLVVVQSTGSVAVAKSSGSGFVTMDDWLTGWAPDSTTRHSMLADVDGDDLDDLLSYSSTTGCWYVARNSGTSFALWSGIFLNGAWTEQLGSHPDYSQLPTTGVDGEAPWRSVHVMTRNPFQRSITIGGSLSTPDNVRLEVFDISGRLIDHDWRTYGAGPWSWTWTPGQLSPGVYLIRTSFLQGSTTTRVRPMP